MRRSAATQALPPSVRRALQKLGEDLSAARRRRRISMEVMAQRAFVTRKTIGRVERGDASVSIAIYATVLFVLGMTERLANLVDPSTDRLGLLLEDEQLPQRIRTKKTS